MILSKKKIANIENRLNELDNVNRHIQLDVITDLETPIKRPGTDIVLYGLYYRVSLQDRFNNIIEQTELKEDAPGTKPADLIHYFTSRYNVPVKITFYDIQNGVEVKKC